MDTNGNGAHRAIYESLARIEQCQETSALQLSEIFNQLRRLPCGTHEFRLDCLDGQAEPPNKKSPSSEHTTYRDLEQSQEHVLAEMKGVAEHTVEQRLDKLEQQRREAREDRRKQISWTLGVIQALAAMLFGGGAVFAARCAVESKATTQSAAAVVRSPASQPTKHVK